MSEDMSLLVGAELLFDEEKIYFQMPLVGIILLLDY